MADQTITIYGDIGHEVRAADLAQQIGKVRARDRIVIRMNSYGGNVHEGEAIYQRLIEHRGGVLIKIDGVAASIASVIAMAGRDIEICAHAEMMIHNAWGIVVGDHNQLAEAAERGRATSERLAKIYARRMKAELSEIQAAMDAETYYMAEEAVEAGLADRIFDGPELRGKFIAERHGYRWPERATPRLDRARARAVALRSRLIAAQ